MYRYILYVYSFLARIISPKPHLHIYTAAASILTPHHNVPSVHTNRGWHNVRFAEPLNGYCQHQRNVYITALSVYLSLVYIYIIPTELHIKENDKVNSCKNTSNFLNRAMRLSRVRAQRRYIVDEWINTG